MRDVLRVKELHEKWGLKAGIIYYNSFGNKTLGILNSELDAKDMFKHHPNGRLVLSTMRLLVYVSNEKKYDTATITDTNKFYHIFSSPRSSIKHQFVIDLDNEDKIINGYDSDCSRKNEMFVPYPNFITADWVQGYFQNPRQYRTPRFNREVNDQIKAKVEELEQAEQAKKEKYKNRDRDNYKSKSKKKIVPSHPIK